MSMMITLVETPLLSRRLASFFVPGYIYIATARCASAESQMMAGAECATDRGKRLPGKCVKEKYLCETERATMDIIQQQGGGNSSRGVPT